MEASRLWIYFRSQLKVPSHVDCFEGDSRIPCAGIINVERSGNLQ